MVKIIMKRRRYFIMGYLCVFITVVIFGIVACAGILELENQANTIKPPTIEVVPKEVTIVPLSTQPIFIKGLGQAEPEPPKVEKPIYYVQQDIHGVLSETKGVNIGPTNKETWYNMDMTNVINNMRRRGFTEEDYPYHVREDGVKCLGDYVIVAADLSIHPRGMVVETSLGEGLVCDTGDFADIGDWYDIATTW